jgi:hypothetical protein
LAPLGGGLGGITVIITSEMELSRLTFVTLGGIYFFLKGISYNYSAKIL